MNRFFKKVEKPQFELSHMRTKSKFAKKVSSKVNVFFARWETVSDVVHSDANKCDQKNRLFEKSRNSTNFY